MRAVDTVIAYISHYDAWPIVSERFLFVCTSVERETRDGRLNGGPFHRIIGIVLIRTAAATAFVYRPLVVRPGVAPSIWE
jgi:hypothetical protein